MITVLMASYNGSRYIEAQIDSVLKQDDRLKLYVQDDCSTDNTWDLLQMCRDKYKQKINIERLGKNTGSPKYNFFSMMSRIHDDYLMLCDQDDIWLPEKVDKTLAKMREMERIHGIDTPLLVHTDLCVVDEELHIINPSFKAAMNANYNRTQLHHQIIQNTLTGCTCMYNRALAKMIGGTTPEYMVMHDWWLMLIASAFGKIGHIDDQTLLYRQHGENEIGAKDIRTLRYKLDRLFYSTEIKEAIAITYKQAESFLTYYRDKLTENQRELLSEYCKIPGKCKLQKWITVCRLGTFKKGIARSIAHFIFI